MPLLFATQWNSASERQKVKRVWMEYEVRHWHSWHCHITLSMMDHAWLASIRHKEMGERRSMMQM